MEASPGLADRLKRTVRWYLDHIRTLPGGDAAEIARTLASLLLWLAVIVIGRYIPFGEV